MKYNLDFVGLLKNAFYFASPKVLLQEIHLPCLDGLFVRELSFLFIDDLFCPIFDLRSDLFLSRLCDAISPLEPEALLISPSELFDFFVPALSDRLLVYNKWITNYHFRKSK